MKKLIIILSLTLAMWAPGGFVLAAYNDFQTNDTVTINISDLGINLTMDSGANVESMTVNGNNLSLAVAANSTITLRSADRRAMDVTSGFRGATFGCPSSGGSTLTITSDASQTGTISISTSQCTVTQASAGGGSGGGGGVPTPTVITPTNASISIKAGAAETNAAEVTLTLSATNATEMMVSNQSNFAGISWESYKTSKTWTLGTGLGKKTVYAKFKSSTGNESAVVSDDVMLLPAQAVAGITSSAGGKVGLSDNLVSVDVPSLAVTKATNITITPSSVYTAPTGKTKVAGSRVYDFKAEADGASVKTFSKDLTLSFKYTSDDIKGLSEGTLAIYYWDEVASKWVKVGGTVDKAKKTVTAKVNHFTLFGIFGEESAVTAAGGGLVKLKCDTSNKSICTAVYYIGNDGKRYVFPTEKTYYTWYSDFSNVKEISATELASYVIGGNITYKPGIKMVKITTDPKVYTVSKGGTLREIASETVAKALYGATWNKQIDDVPDPFFINYKVGAKINAAADYDVAVEKVSSADINADKGL